VVKDYLVFIDEMLGKGQYGQVCKAKLVSEAKSKTAKILNQLQSRNKREHEGIQHAWDGKWIPPIETEEREMDESDNNNNNNNNDNNNNDNNNNNNNTISNSTIDDIYNDMIKKDTNEKKKSTKIRKCIFQEWTIPLPRKNSNKT
jgi:hypothetical protein